jgi:hypothetical protein
VADALSTAEVVRDRTEVPPPPTGLISEPPSTSGVTLPGAPAFGDIAGFIAPKIAAAEKDVADARGREKAGLEARAAAVNPLIDSAQTGMEQLRQHVATTPPPPAPVITEPPSRGLTAFLSPRAGETAEASIGKFIQAIGLFATGISGMAKGDARGALAAMTGAMDGWHRGDKEYADRQFADWHAKTESALSRWKTQRTAYEDWFKVANLSVEQMIQGAKLEALKHDNTQAALALETGGAEKFLAWLGEQQKHADTVQTAMLKIVDARERQQAFEEFKRTQLDILQQGVDARREAIAAGKAREAEAKAARGATEADRLRDDFTKASSDFVKVRDAYARIQASSKNPTPAGDLSLIFNYMKMLDPGSVVRESEFATAAAAGSYGERFQAAMERITKGTRLSPEMRADFVDRSEKLYREQLTTHEESEREYKSMATRGGLDVGRAVPDLPGRFRAPKAAEVERRVAVDAKGNRVLVPITTDLSKIPGASWER